MDDRRTAPRTRRARTADDARRETQDLANAASPKKPPWPNSSPASAFRACDKARKCTAVTASKGDDADATTATSNLRLYEGTSEIQRLLLRRVVERVEKHKKYTAVSDSNLDPLHKGDRTSPQIDGKN